MHATGGGGVGGCGSSTADGIAAAADHGGMHAGSGGVGGSGGGCRS